MIDRLAEVKPELGGMNSSLMRPLAVVTDASSGFGYQLAQQFAQNGFDLLVTAADSSINQAVHTLKQFGVQVEAAQIAITTYDGVYTLYNKIKATKRPVETIAINTGIHLGGEPSYSMSLKDELNRRSLNMVLSVHLAKQVLKDMVKRGHGRVLFICSNTVPLGAVEANYTVFKAFLYSFTEALHHQFKHTGVSVTALMPDSSTPICFQSARKDDTDVSARQSG